MVLFVERRRLGPCRGSSQPVSNLIHHRLAEVRLERAFVTRLKVAEILERT